MERAVESRAIVANAYKDNFVALPFSFDGDFPVTLSSLDDRLKRIAQEIYNHLLDLQRIAKNSRKSPISLKT